MQNWIIAAAVGIVLCDVSAQSLAGGFAIGTQSGSGTGNAFSGGAASADDASTVWFNPAGMSYLPAGKNVAVTGHALKPSFKFSNIASNGAFAAPGTGEGGDAGDWTPVPQAFFTTDLGRYLKLGLGLNVPFGLKTQYDAGWRGQFSSLKSEIKTINLNGALSYRVSDSFSVGVGVSWQKLQAQLTSFSGPFAGGAKIKGDDNNWGMNIGVIFSPTPATRIGVHYRSSIGYKLTGNASFTVTPALNGGVSADLTVPESFSLSFFSAVSPQWDLMGDVTWTRWSRVDRLNVVRTTGAVLNTLTLNWDNTTRVSIGMNYKPNPIWKFRFGVAYDPTPTNDRDRTARLPDEDRLWVAFGAQYRLSDASTLDVGYAHEFIRDASVNNTVAGVPGALVGAFENKADIVSVQFNHSF
jgi:long-chain fatty acid transport protein